MIFPLTTLLSDQASTAWVEKHFHPNDLRCPNCGAKKKLVRLFRQRRRAPIDFRCLDCNAVFNLYHGTIFAGSNLRPRQVVLRWRGVCNGESSPLLAAELERSRQRGSTWRQRLQANDYRMRKQTPLKDCRTATAEMFQKAGKKAKSTAAPINSGVLALMRTTAHRRDDWPPQYYVAMCEHKINWKRISPACISQLVKAHLFFT